jgi:hypothetical protein
VTLTEILRLYREQPCIRPDSLDHFDQLQKVAPTEHLGAGIAGMLRSSSTAPFGQTVGMIFQRANSEERAGLLKAVSANCRESGSAAFAPESDSTLDVERVSALAGELGCVQPTVIDSVAAYLAQHPHLVRVLGPGSVAVAMIHMSPPQEME